jgi:hypothetical protein
MLFQEEQLNFQLFTNQGILINNKIKYPYSLRMKMEKLSK